MPHICKRNKIYYVFWYEQGKHHCKAISPLYKDAEKWSANLTLRLYSQRNGMPVRFYPFKDFVQEYIKEYVNFKAPRTKLRDFTTLNTLFRHFPSIEYVKDFDELLLRQYISIRTKEGSSKATINRELGTLKNMQRVAFEKGYLEYNIASKTKMLSIKDNIATYIPSDEDVQFIVDKATEPLKTAFVLGVTCGMRAGEVCHIELSDIDFKQNIIHIRPKPHMNWSPKNNTSIRDVPIHPSYKGYLLKQYKLAKKIKSNLLCCYEDGRILKEGVIASMITKLRKKYDIDKRFHFHCLRHKFITLTANSGVPMIQIKNIVGHSNTKVTEAIYYHSTNQKNIEAISNVDIPLKVGK